MTYDLHGPWDDNVKKIGAIDYGKTNVPKIAN
jgi:GH18 family chitinase